VKPSTLLAASGCAFFGLLYGAASHATDISRRPVRPDALVKPNVVFAMDDSGSLDWETLLDTDSGLLWWDWTRKLAWTGGRFLAKADHPRGYLFPLHGVGGDYYARDDANGYGFAVVPTPQFAALRSNAYNPLYYNPAATYAPWAPAWHDGALHTYGPATASQAKSHPALANSLTMDLASVQSYDFVFASGMTLPDGTTNATHQKVTTAYYPATYWVPEDCGAVDNTSYASTCASAPDGHKLKRYEIKAGRTFPSGRSYADELQNFANWWSYHRKRKLMLAGAMGTVLGDLTGMRVGVVSFNRHVPVAMVDADASDPADNRLRIAGAFYTNPADKETPTAATLNYIGRQYHENDDLIRASCQRNNVFVVTDGYATDSATPPAYTAAAKVSNGVPYQPTTPGSLADVALAYYTLDARNNRSRLKSGLVPPADKALQNADLNTDLHVNTYALTLRVFGTLWPATTDAWSAPVAWPDPSPGTAASIDDLWHATINGRGRMYTAADPRQTADAIRQGLTNMLDQGGAQSAAGVGSVNLRRGDGKVYLGKYTPAGWGGDVTANSIDPRTAAVTPAPTWSAAARLAARNWSTRRIATFSGGGRAFTTEGAGSLVNPSGDHTAALMGYLRGQRDGETSGAYRIRTSLMGAVINAQPVVSTADAVVYAASGEGMLHAFDTGSGEELWAYVPGTVLPQIARSAARSYYFQTLLDGTPTLATVAGRKLLVGGLGSAGAGYYAIDVTAPRAASEADLASKVLWDTAKVGGVALGLALGRPLVVNAAGGGAVVLLTQGYNGTGGSGALLHMVDAFTGAPVTTFKATDGSTDPELGQVSAMAEADGTVRHVYGGDAQGNLWHFDLVDKTTARLATFKDANGQPQPVTAAPELVRYGSHRLVLVGTGRLLGATDLGATTAQSFYAVKDGADLPNARASLRTRTLGVESNGKRSIQGSGSVDWATDRGWMFDLPAGLQANTDPSVASGAVVFTANAGSESDCSLNSSLFVVDLLNGRNVVDMAWAVQSLGGRSASAVSLIGSGGGDDACGPICGVTQLSDGQVRRERQPLDTGVKARKNAWRQIRQ
jgi:type IV pilus assembly protein PilY1